MAGFGFKLDLENEDEQTLEVEEKIDDSEPDENDESIIENLDDNEETRGLDFGKFLKSPTNEEEVINTHGENNTVESNGVESAKTITNPLTVESKDKKHTTTSIDSTIKNESDVSEGDNNSSRVNRVTAENVDDFFKGKSKSNRSKNSTSNDSGSVENIENSKKVKEEIVNPFLEDDEEGYETEVISVPEEPTLDEEAEKNKKRRDLKRHSRQDFFAKRDDRELEGEGFLRREVVVEEILESSKPVKILTESGEDKWSVKPSGKIQQEEIEIFKNLNRRKGDVLDDLELRNLLAGKTVEAKKSKQAINRAIYGDESLVRGSRKRFTDKDRDLLKFLAMFKYSNARHCSHIFQVTERAVLKRLRKLRDAGLIIEKKLYGTKPIWYLTEAGMVLSGMELPRPTEQTITYTMLPHQFVVNHVASNLWGGGVNVLNLADFPVENRLDRDGMSIVGEELVSELQLQSSLSSIKLTNRAEAYRPMMMDQADRLFGAWEAGNFKGESPERVEGNEHLWVILPPASLKKAYHVPDLVVSRPHNKDGSPESIAVEIELANKAYESYEKVLNAYRTDSRIYKMVVWVVKSAGAARKIEEAAVKLDMWEDERVDVVPIYTEEGVFNGQNEWVI